MQLAWSLSLWIVVCLHIMPMSTMTMTTSKPKLIVSSAEEPQLMMYHFIIDHRPTTLGQNYYIKPGQVVGTFSLDSDTLLVKHEDSKRPISSKFNILFVANAKEEDESIKNKQNE